MAKAITSVKRQKRTDLSNLSQRDKDILTLETREAMQKYSLGKQGVYDRKFALNKRLRAAGITLEQVMKNAVKSEPAPEQVQPEKVQAKKVQAKKVQLKKVQAKKVQAKKVQAKKVQPKITETEKTAPPAEEKLSDSRDVMVINKQIPVIMKPIEINFDNFSIRLNGVPKKISVNPDTNAIEIDL